MKRSSLVKVIEEALEEEGLELDNSEETACNIADRLEEEFMLVDEEEDEDEEDDEDE